MGIDKNRVYDLEEMSKLLTNTQKLMNTADSVVNGIYSHLCSLSVILASLPADVRDNSLVEKVNDLKKSIRTDEFMEYKAEITKAMTRIMENVPLQDKRLGVKIKHVTDTLNTMTDRIKNLTELIPSGADAGSYEDFDKALKECTRDWDSVNSQVDELMGKIIASLKGGKNTQVCYGGDPVNLSTGNFILEKTDMEIAGTPKLVLTRFYNELEKRQGMLGRGWRLPYEVSLKAAGDTYIVILEDGREEYFEKRKSGILYGEAARGRLTEVEEGFRYRMKNGDTYFFNPAGNYIAWENLEGNRLEFSYSEEGLEQVLRKEDGAYFSFSYDEAGLLVRVSDQEGRSADYGWDEAGRLVSVRNPAGGEEQYGYQEDGRLTVVTDPEGNQLKNQYDSQGRVLAQSFPDGSTISYEYEDDESKVTVTERNKSRVTYCHNETYQNIRTIYEDGEEKFLYNGRGQKILRRDCRGNMTRFSYDPRGNVTRIVDAMGTKSNAIYDENNRLLKISVNGKEQLKNNYDRAGNLTESRDALGRKTCFEYWKNGKPKQITRPDGGKVCLSYDGKGNITSITDPYGNCSVYEYDSFNRIVGVRDPKGGKSVYGYDAMNRMIKFTNPIGQVMEYQYNASGKQTAARRFDGEIIQTEYNNMNRPSTVINAAGARLELGYDGMGNVSEARFPDGTRQLYEYDSRNRLTRITDPMGGQMEYDYDAEGNCILERTPNGEETRYTYNARNELESMTDSEGNQTFFSYNEKGLLAERTDALGNTESYDYDAAGQKIRETNVLGKSRYFTYTQLGNVETLTDETGGVTHYDYEQGGRLAGIRYPDGTGEQFTYDENSNVSTHSFSSGLVLSYEYDSLNRVCCLWGNDGSRMEYTYDENGKVRTATDALGNTTSYDYSVIGKLVKVTDALGQETGYRYDVMGRLAEISQYGEITHRTKYQRNPCGQVEMVMDSLGFKEFYTYNSNGQLVERKDRDGYVTQYGYTPLGDVNHIRYGDGKEVSLQYDPLRQLVQVKDWLGVTQFENDALGRMEKAVYPDGKEILYTYGESGNRESLSYPDGQAITYAYDSCQRLSEIRDGDRVVSYSYDEMGKLKEKNFPNNMHSVYRYDSRGRIRELVHEDAEGILDRYGYQYDLLGNRTKAEKYRRGLLEESGKWEYSYDSLGRLSAVKKEGQLLRHYQYDAFGNRILKEDDCGQTEYEYNAGSRLLRMRKNNGERTVQYEYDNRGNMTAVREDGVLVNRYDYGAMNRLERAVNEKGTAAWYEYNGLGYRVGKQTACTGTCLLENSIFPNRQDTNPDQEIQYRVDLTRSARNLLEKTENGMVQRFLWDENGVSLLQEGKRSYYFQDDLGSPVRLADEEGKLLESYGYGDFGEDLYQNQGKGQPFGYTGYQPDPVSGTLFAQAREYLPQAGRFAGEDRVKGTTEQPARQNPYGYCFSSPFTWIDLTGLIPEMADWLLKGDEAHKLLEAKFKKDYGWRGGETEYNINGGVTRTPSGNGRADIVYFNSAIQTIEVYEIKPGSYSPGAVNYDVGIDQLDGYIDAIMGNGQIIKDQWSVSRGYTLNEYFDTIVLPSDLHNDQEIVYHVYEDGLINYYYRKKEKEPQPVTVPEPEPGPDPSLKIESIADNDDLDGVKTAAEVVGAAGGAYLLYRAVRLIPSLAPPLWWTLPANVACP